MFRKIIYVVILMACNLSAQENEIGIFFMFRTDISYVKNGGDVLIEEFIKMLGLNH